MTSSQQSSQELKRPRTLHFPLKLVRRIDGNDVVKAISKVTSDDHITAVQFTRTECRITFSNVEAKQKVKVTGLDIGGSYVKLLDADRAFTSITIKDAPVEMEDCVVMAKLSQYGKVMEGSMKRGKIRGTNIENGIRYVNLTNMEENVVIPATCQIGRFEICLVCDQNKNTRSKQQPYTSASATGVRRCYRCLSTGHLKHECENEVVCKYCGQSGHIQKDCMDHKELELDQLMDEKLQLQLQGLREGTDPAENGELGAPGAEEDMMSDVSEDEEDADSKADTWTQDCKAVILGASLVKHMDLKGNAALISKSGTQAAEVDSLLKIAEAKLEASKVEKVVIHLGTNDLSRAHGDVDTVKLNLVEAVNKVKAFFPDAVTGVAAIPPRKGKGAKVHRYNNEAKSVNHYLRTLADRDTRVEFLDTYQVFAPGGEHVVKRLYSERDSSGVHLSAEGISLLQGEFEKFLSTESDSRERQRCSPETPPSVEKVTKKGKNDQ